MQRKVIGFVKYPSLTANIDPAENTVNITENRALTAGVACYCLSVGYTGFICWQENWVFRGQDISHLMIFSLTDNIQMLRPYKLSQIRSCCAVAAERSPLATRPCWVPRHYPGIPAAALVMAVALTITT